MVKSLMDRMSLCDKIDYDTFQKLHTDYIIPLDIKIDSKLFEEEIKEYHEKFKQWGPSHTQFPRYGLPLVNMNGSLDNKIDPGCWPLDTWADHHPDKIYWYPDFRSHTEVMKLESLKPLEIISNHMLRSCILWWNNTGHLKPHVDMLPDYITHLRLWGTNKTDKEYHFQYSNGYQLKDFEPGRIYLSSVVDEHRAFATEDYTYTFFIAVDLNSIPLIESLKI